MNAVEPMSRADQMTRRKQMAEIATDPDSFGAVAAKFGVSIETVKNACRIYAPSKLVRRVPARRQRRKVPA